MKDKYIKKQILLALKFWNKDMEDSAKIVIENLVNEMIYDEVKKFIKELENESK